MAANQHITGWLLAFVLFGGVFGCDSPSTSTAGGGGSSMDDMATAVSARREAEKKAEQERVEAEKKAQEAAVAEAAANPPRQLVGRPAVEPGGGYFNAIIGARRHALNETERWPWLQAVQHFEAEHGRLPKDHEEFMNKVVIPLEINLGYKEDNQEFFYDPNEGEWGELYVVDVAPAGQTVPPQQPAEQPK